MFEYTYAQGGKLYCLFESASDIYRNVSRKPISYVMPIKLSAVCDEKQGSILNITTTNVENGKYVNASCTEQGADVYYSTSVPYIKKGGLSSGYLYPNGYLKQNTSMVYAVAVVDGRIIACDSIYISVGTALAPSNLKVLGKRLRLLLLMQFTEAQAKKRILKGLQLFPVLNQHIKILNLKRIRSITIRQIISSVYLR